MIFKKVNQFEAQVEPTNIYFNVVSDVKLILDKHQKKTLLNFRVIVFLVFSILTPVSLAEVQEFSVESADGTTIHGQVDLPDRSIKGAVVFVAGTGLFDRDARFGRTGTPRDLIFADLAQRMNTHGLATVRYDRRGVRYGEAPTNSLDKGLSATSTITTLRDDLGAVYSWTENPDELNARCVVFFAHSEGLAHVGRLAVSGALQPNGVIAMGGLLESPQSVLKWQAVERATYSLHLMDSNNDNRVTNEEVEANFKSTPVSVTDSIAPFIQPDGEWSEEDLQNLPILHAAAYEQERKKALLIDDSAPYPSAETPMANYSWWKNWFTDDTPVAQLLSVWHVPMIFHYGSKDSQTNFDRQRSAAEDLFENRATFYLHQGLGHSLGKHAFYGPLDEDLAEQIASEAAQTCSE